MGHFQSLFKFAYSETPISKYIPYSHHVTDKIVSTVGADYISVWKIDGRSHQTASQDEVTVWINELNNLFRGIASANLAVWSHVVRRRVDEYPESEFKNTFCAQLDKNYRDSFSGYNLMVNDLYLTVVYRPVTDKVMSFFAAAEKQSLDDKKLQQAACIKALEEINRTIEAGLGKRYGAESLGVYEHNGYSYSSALEFLAFLVNGEHIRMPVSHTRARDYMPQNRILFSKTSCVGEIRSLNSEKFFGMVDVFDYPDPTEPGHLNAMLESSYEFVITHSLSCHSTNASKGIMSKQKKALEDSNDVAVSQIDAIDDALDLLVSGHFFGGDHHCTINVFADTVRQVEEQLASVRATLADYAVIVKPCDNSLEAAFWAQLPGNFSSRPRPSYITSQNFLCFSPLHNFMSGKPNGNPWGEAVTILKTISGTPLYFNFHYSKADADSTDKRLLGNTMFIGKSGTGKTVSLGFMLAQAQKFGPTCVAFDKDRGMEIAIRAMGGRYLPLKTGEASGFNPFQLEPTSANMSFLKKFIKALAAAGGPVTHADELQINQALDTLMHHIDKPLRRLSMLVQSLPNPHFDDGDHRATVHSRLIKWCAGHELGWLFDNPTDALDLTTHQMYGFDVTEFLENPETRGPVMMYLIYRTEAMIDGRRFMYIFDEFWKPLEDEYFQDLVKNKQKTIRKQNGLCVFATQEADDIKDSPIASTLVGQCATFVLLPNPEADRDTYTKVFKLTDSEFDVLRSLGEDSRCFLIKQGGNSAVAKLSLHGFEDELLVLSGTPDNAELAEQLVAELGEDPDVWLPEFYKRVRASQQRS